MNHKTAHTYSKAFKGNYGQVRDVIVVEATWLGYHEPYTTRSVVSFVGQMMLDNGQPELAAENGLLPFDVLTLEPTRTICEKIMSLVRFSYRDNPLENLRQKIRHTYDLHQLLQQPEFAAFSQSETFGEMLLKVANDDVVSFKNNNGWLAHYPTEALLFRDLETVWASLKGTYNTEFSNLVYGTLPKDDAVLQTLKGLSEGLKGISWRVNLSK